MSKVIINDTLLEYALDGEGEPLTLVQGSASDYRTWHKPQEEFFRRYRVITYRRRYHWLNEEIPEEADYSMTEHVQDLQARIQELGATPVHLVGHSSGAFPCLLLTIQRLELVRELVLAEPPVFMLFVRYTPKPLELLGLMLNRPRTAIAIMNFGVKGMAPA